MKKESIPVTKLNNGPHSKMINRGAELDKQIKALSVELEGIKTELEALSSGKYVTKEGSTVTISETDKYTDVDPVAAKQLLRDKRLGRMFISCIKVSVTEIKKFLSETELKTLRSKSGVSRRYSFK